MSAGRGKASTGSCGKECQAQIRGMEPGAGGWRSVGGASLSRRGRAETRRGQKATFGPIQWQLSKLQENAAKPVVLED